MRIVALLELVLIFVAGIAVNGSRAQPLRTTSVAFEQCLNNDMVRSSQCQALIRPLVAQTELEAAGDRAPDDASTATAAGAAAGVGSDEIGQSKFGWFHVPATWEVARYLWDNRFFPGTITRRPSIVTETIFDPNRSPTLLLAMDRRQPVHRHQPRRRREHPRERVDGQRTGRHIAMDAAGDCHGDGRIAFDGHGIPRTRGGDRHCEVQRDRGPATAESCGDLMQAPHRVAVEHGLDALVDRLERPA